jgi:hypothetical protein
MIRFSSWPGFVPVIHVFLALQHEGRQPGIVLCMGLFCDFL